MTAFSCRPNDRRAAFSGVATLVDAIDGGEHGRVPVVRAEVREHVVLEDLLAFAVGQERGREPGGRVELDLPARAARLEVEEDRQPVVEPFAADAPLVDERQRVALGVLGRGGVDDLGINDHLGLRSLLNAIDRLLDCGNRLRLEDAGEVVHGAVDLRLRKRWPGRWRVGRSAGVRGRSARQLATELHQRACDGDDRRGVQVALRAPD